MRCKDIRFSAWRVGAGCAVVASLATLVMAQEESSDSTVLNERASQLDPQDYQFMRPVCTGCHDPSVFLHSRSWSEWQDVFFQMSRYGAKATQAQWSHIFRYVERNLTLIDVNHADEDELSAVLGVDENTAIAIVQRRSDRKFSSAADVESIPGVDKAVVETL